MGHDAPPFFRGDGMPFDTHGGGAGALGWTIFALQLLLLAGLIVLLVRAFATGGPRMAAAPRMRLHRGGAPDALAVVRLRYARGEIGRDEYLQATRDLGGTADEAPTEELPPS